MPWGAKKGSSQVSTNLCCAISVTHSCIQKPEIPGANVPATISAKEFMEPESDEV